jgi:hypothetical protein
LQTDENFFLVDTLARVMSPEGAKESTACLLDFSQTAHD